MEAGVVRWTDTADLMPPKRPSPKWGAPKGSCHAVAPTAGGWGVYKDRTLVVALATEQEAERIARKLNGETNGRDDDADQ